MNVRCPGCNKWIEDEDLQDGLLDSANRVWHDECASLVLSKTGGNGEGVSDLEAADWSCDDEDN